MRGRTLLTMVIACTPLLHAQQGIQLGPKYIPTATWFLNDDDAATSSSRSAFGFGANYHFKDGTGAGLEVIWSTGTQIIRRDNATWEHELSYVKVPLLLHFNSGSEDVVPFLGYFGLEYVKLREAHLFLDGRNMDEAAFVDANGVRIADKEPKDLFRSSDLGVVLGFGPGWNINERLQFTAIARADHLFHDPENKDASFYWGSERPKTSLFTLGLYLGLKLIIATTGR